MNERLSTPYKFSKDKETKMPIFSKSPTLKAKLNVSYKDMKINSSFYYENDEKIDALSLLNTKFELVGAFAIESIYLGDAYTTFQIKLIEGIVFPISNTSSRLLKSKKIIEDVSSNKHEIKTETKQKINKKINISKTQKNKIGVSSSENEEEN